MKVNVWHRNNETKTYMQVAQVDCSGKTQDEALEYCWRWTNNVLGSWSKKEEESNGDLNDRVTVTCELPVNKDGVRMGLRSSMQGDIFETETRDFIVGAIGFKMLPQFSPLVAQRRRSRQ